MKVKGVLLGIKASIIASSCCSIPVALILLFSATGAGSMTAALAIARYKFFFITVGTLFLAISLYFTIKRNCGGVCTLADARKNKRLIAISSLVYLSLTLAFIYVILPWIAEMLL